MAGGYFRKILDYCDASNVRVPSAFRGTDPSKFVLIDISIEQRPILVSETFDYQKQIYEFLKHQNVHPENYRILNFKDGREYV